MSGGHRELWRDPRGVQSKVNTTGKRIQFEDTMINTTANLGCICLQNIYCVLSASFILFITMVSSSNFILHLCRSSVRAMLPLFFHCSA